MTVPKSMLTAALAVVTALVPAVGAAASEPVLPKPKPLADGGRVHVQGNGKFPAAPRVRLKGRTEKAPTTRIGQPRRPNPEARPTPLPKPQRAGIAIDGWHGPYANKMAWIQYYTDNYMRRILGSRYKAPALYPDAQNYAYFNCGTYRQSVVNNAIYCPTNNYIAWDTNWFLSYFNYAYGGDMSVAAIYAHEWGHGSQHMLRLSGPKLRYSLYQELYADCMSGAWAADMYRGRHLDNIGVGDYNEAHNVMAWLGSPNTPGRTHGTAAERQAYFRYGWTNGAQTCVSWVTS